MSTLTLSSTTIQVTWNEVPPIERNGIITAYQVQYIQTAFNKENVLVQKIDEPALNTTLYNLHEYTTYTIRVQAFTTAGPGPYSNETVVTTFEDSKCKNLKVVFNVDVHICRTCCFASWYPCPSNIFNLSLCLMEGCACNTPKWDPHLP